LRTNKKFHARQLSGMNNKNKYILAVIAKRSYSFNADGKCYLIEAEKIVEDIEVYSESNNLIDKDMDIYLYKPYTDIIVKGKARTASKTRQFVSRVGIGNRSVEMLIIGNRKVYLDSSSQKLKFSDPEFIHEVPLRYDYAYGGVDIVAEKKLQQPPDEILKTLPSDVDWREGNPFRYPRNPCGKGYIVEFNKSMIEQLELPNIEDVSNRLTTNNIITGSLDKWINMPLPVCTDWVSPIWFPRLTYFGFIHNPVDLSITPEEVKKGLADNNIMDNLPPQNKFNIRSANGASLGLQTPHLRGDEIITLENIHPTKTIFNIELPNDIPDIFVDGRKGKLKPTVPIIQTLVIRSDEKKIDIVWSGNAEAIRPYMEEELKEMPFKVKWRLN